MGLIVHMPAVGRRSVAVVIVVSVGGPLRRCIVGGPLRRLVVGGPLRRRVVGGPLRRQVRRKVLTPHFYPNLGFCIHSHKPQSIPKRSIPSFLHKFPSLYHRLPFPIHKQNTFERTDDIRQTLCINLSDSNNQKTNRFTIPHLTLSLRTASAVKTIQIKLQL